MKGNTTKDISRRKIEKIKIIVQADIPDPFPMMPSEEIRIGTGNEQGKNISVNRNQTGTLLLISVTDEGQEIGRGYVVDVGQIVQGILAYENWKADPKGERASDMWPEQPKA
jgi:hypothetical protein